MVAIRTIPRLVSRLGVAVPVIEHPELNSLIKQSLPLAALYTATLIVLWQPDDMARNVLALCLSPILIWVSLEDFRSHHLPNMGSALIAGVGIVYWAVVEPSVLVAHVLTGAAVLMVFWAVGAWYFRRHGEEGLGIGDAKLFAAGALVVGPWQVPGLILFASVGGIVGYGLRALRARAEGGRSEARGLPFGPFIAFAVVVVGASY